MGQEPETMSRCLIKDTIPQAIMAATKALHQPEFWSQMSELGIEPIHSKIRSEYINL